MNNIIIIDKDKLIIEPTHCGCSDSSVELWNVIWESMKIVIGMWVVKYMKNTMFKMRRKSAAIIAKNVF